MHTTSASVNSTAILESVEEENGNAKFLLRLKIIAFLCVYVVRYRNFILDGEQKTSRLKFFFQLKKFLLFSCEHSYTIVLAPTKKLQ
jgi:hypothetical protein